MKNILLAVALFAGIHLYAQVNVGSSEISQLNKAGKLSDDDIKELKSTTTLFILQEKDYVHVADFEKTIAAVWKVSPFKIIKLNEMDSYAQKGGYSFFSFGGYYTERSHNMVSEKSLFTVHLSYDLWIPVIGKKGNIKDYRYFSRILLSQDAEVIKTATRKYGRNFEDKMMEYAYKDAVFNNWGAGFLKGYLATINGLLMQGETRGRFTSDEDEKGIENLKQDTLYVPDYINVHYSPYTMQEKESDKDQDNLQEVYSHPLKLVTASQLNDMIIHSSRPLYYLVYVRSASDKFVSVYHSDQGMVYARYTPVSYNFKYKDLNGIEKVLR